jgi:uncharacterized membrane protein
MSNAQSVSAHSNIRQKETAPGTPQSHDLSGTPQIRKIETADIRVALSKGYDDFMAKPSHVVFLALIYPVAGLFIAEFTIGYEFFPLLFPLMAGFALLGPFAAIGLYEISRRRENGLGTSWKYALDVRHSPSFGSILVLGALLMAIFMLWLGAAWWLYQWTFDGRPLVSIPTFLQEVLTTPHGWALILLGNGLGFLFAVVAFSISVVSFPLLLEQDVGVATAIATSVRAVRTNPKALATWGLVIAVALVLGSLPAFIGLAVVMPVLAHASWHMYRRVVV